MPFATPDRFTISDMEVLLIPLEVKRAKADSNRESRFCFLFNSSLIIKKTFFQLLMVTELTNTNIMISGSKGQNTFCTRHYIINIVS